MFRSVLLTCLLIAITRLAALSRRDSFIDAAGVQSCSTPVLGCLYRSGWFRSILAVSTLTAGLIGPNYELSIGTTDTGWFTLYPLFGVLVLGTAISRFFWYLGIPPAMRCSDMNQFSHHESRGVYLLLYTEILLKEAAGLLHAGYRGGSFDGKSLHAYFKLPADQVMSEFTYEFRGYVVCSLIAIVAIRILAAVYERPGGRRA